MIEYNIQFSMQKDKEWVTFHQYHGENKLIFNEVMMMMMRSTLF
jgi:hypothetical protein